MMQTKGPLTEDGRFVVVIDGSPTDTDQVKWAVGLAQRAQAHLEIVHASSVTEWSAAMAASLETSDYPARIRNAAQQRLEEAVQSAHELDPGIEVDSKIVELSAAKMAESISADATLLILAADKSGPLRDIAFGHSATTVINAASCPTLVWRARGDDVATQEGPVVVGVDGSDPSKRALAAAFDLAHVLGVELLVVHVGASSETDGLYYSLSVDWSHLREAERKWLQSMVDAYHDDYPTVSVRALSVGASVARELRALSGTAQVVVVGSRGRGRLSAAVLGSVSQNLVHHADCPVLVVH